MPVLINKETRLAEDLPQDQAEAALYSGSHEVPLMDQNGQLGSSPFQDAQRLVQSGTHAQLTPEQLQGLLEKTNHSSLAEQAKTFAEGAAQATTFGLSTPIEIGMGVNPKDINARRETNPKAHMAGQVTALLGGALIPGGAEAGALKALGEGAEGALFAGKTAGAIDAATAAAKVAGETLPEQLSFGSRLARGATRLGTEGAAFQAGDELSQHFEDPDRAMSLSAANIGMAALTTPIIGGALSGAAGLFKATKAAELQHVLESMKGYADAASSGSDLAPSVADTLADSPELKGAMSDNPSVQRAYQSLINSNSGVGEDFSAKVAELKNAVNEGAVQRLGFEPADIDGPNLTSANKAGSDIVKHIDTKLSEELKPINELYETTNDKYSESPIYPAMRKNLAKNLAELSDEQGYMKAPGSPGYKIMAKLEEELPLQKTANDIRKYSENIAKQIGDEDFFLKRKVTGILRDAADQAVLTRLGETEGPEALNIYGNARQGYADLMNKIDDLDSRLKLGRYKGPVGALKNLKEMQPERVLSRLSNTNDAGLIDFLNTNFPEVSQMVRKNQLQTFARDSVLKDGFSVRRFLDKIDDLPPETRGAVLDPATYEKLNADYDLLERLKGTINPSGTKKASSAFMRQTAGGLGGYALGAIFGPKAAFLLGTLGKYFSDVPDALRVAFLRSVGNGKTPDAMAFKALVDAASQASKAAKVINRGVRSVVSGSGSFTVNQMTDREKKTLEEAATTYEKEPEKFINNEENGHLAQYEPDHTTARNVMVARAMQEILAAKPKTRTNGMLDSVTKPSKAQLADYNKTLNIVQNPLTILSDMQKGVLTPKSLGVFSRVYPGLHSMLSEKITNQIIEMKAKKESVPYKQRLMFSMFLGSPLDSTMAPAAIMANQPKPVTNPQPPQAGGKSLKALSGLANIAQTTQQGREEKRVMR